MSDSGFERDLPFDCFSSCSLLFYNFYTLVALAILPRSRTQTADPLTLGSGNITGYQLTLLHDCVLIFKTEKLGYTQYVTDGRPEFAHCQVPFPLVEISNTGPLSTGICLFMTQTRKLAPRSTLRFHIYICVIKAQETGLT